MTKQIKVSDYVLENNPLIEYNDVYYHEDECACCEECDEQTPDDYLDKNGVCDRCRNAHEWQEHVNTEIARINL